MARIRLSEPDLEPAVLGIDDGRIVGRFDDASGRHGYILVIPEPSTLTHERFRHSPDSRLGETGSSSLRRRFNGAWRSDGVI